MTPTEFDQGTLRYNSLKVAATLLQHYESMLQDGHFELTSCGFDLPDGRKAEFMPEKFVAFARDGVDSVIAGMTEQAGINRLQMIAKEAISQLQTTPQA
jgi:hypothetical protein